MLLINQLAKQTGLPIHTIRFYEKSGLFHGKKDEKIKSNNYTYYDEEVLEKLELIRDAKSVGFTLAEINELIDAWYSKKITKEQKIEILNVKMKAIEEKIDQLKEMKNQIVEFIKEVEEFDC